jgi:hypothetical protein
MLMESFMELLSGSCLCGAVQYEVTPPLKFVSHDHCSICRRASGAAFVTWAGVVEPRLRITRGEEKMTRYQSSPEAYRRFCSVCGSQLTFQSTKWPGEVHFTVATLLQPIEKQPQAHVFFSDKVPWCEINDSLPRFGGATGLEPL